MFGKHEKELHFSQRAKLVASHLKLGHSLIPHIKKHLHKISQGKAPIIWLQGQNCTGCSVSLMNSEHFSPVDLGYEKLSLRYQPDIMSASGLQAEAAIEETESEKGMGYILVVEGSIPTGEFSRFCTFGLSGDNKDLSGRKVPDDKTIEDWLKELVPGAEAIIAVGNCAAFGGIPSLLSEVTGAISIGEVVAGIDAQQQVLNVSGCPPHPDWIVGTIIDVLLWKSGQKEAPELDEHNRLVEFYGDKIHDHCERKQAFEEKRFLLDWNDDGAQEAPCLLKLGCRGPRTHGDCPIRLWNLHVNWCVGANAPCQGCAEPGFHLKLPKPHP
ncbi:MAG: iron hydrogenase [Actinobacteria bacterium]|jgi:NiFe hydrogenase small subunit HydA|nr:MAG: iron hydrogenase [Actinomycetota bacterium]